ncbi:uncharacterized protein [Misgurnus anguillicaudatus]|uniref:uncharacterized protein n=1 Tax=Misgurnus anguillicaudatus TaxID=75329 RepID=UPI003CCF27C3
MNYGDMNAISIPVEAGYDTVGSTHYFIIPDSNDGNLIPNLKSSSNVNTPGRWAFSANLGIVQFSEIFYPVGLAVGDVQTFTTSANDESYASVNLASPFVYFGHTYNLIYVNYYGVLSFYQPIPEEISYNIPTYGSVDVIAPLWADLDDYGLTAFYYHEYTSGNVLTRATEDIKRYYPGLSFNATWVFVATWDFVYTWDQNTFLHHSAPSISFQAVLISDGVSSFILMNYGDMSVIGIPLVAGYDTVGSTHYFVIPGSNNGYLIPNLKYSSNVNAPGRWAFYANQSIVQFSEIFYPVGLAAGDAQTVVGGTDDYVPVNLASPFLYFGRPYSLIYVNNNGLLSFSRPIPEAHPFTFPSGGEDLIAALWTELDDYGYGEFYYHEYTSGNVLTRATEDIRHHYPGLSFNATWVFVATWDYVETWDLNTFLYHSGLSISFQAVLISDGVYSFILMNYGDMSTIVYPTEAGYDTVGSTHYYVIPMSNNPNLIPNLKFTSNVNTQGRWAFSANRENVVGLQMQVTSLLDLTDSGNLAFVMQKLKDELVNRGMPSDLQVTPRRVQKTP